MKVRGRGRGMKEKSRGHTVIRRKMPMIEYSSCIEQTPYTRKSGARTLHRLRVLGTQNDPGLHLFYNHLFPHAPLFLFFLNPSNHSTDSRIMPSPLH